MNDTAKSFDLTGKVALISGASRGIGAETARALASAGAKVVLCDVLDKEGRELVASLTRAHGDKAWYFHLDVTDEAGWQSVMQETVSVAGGLDIVVNNAGIEVSDLIENFAYDDFRRQIAVNVDGVFLGCREAVRAMKPGGIAGRGGSIVNLSSIAGLVGAPGYSVYGGSKGFVRMMSKHLAVECGRLQYGIRVNSVHPGLIETKMGAKVLDDFVRMGLVQSVEQATQAVKALTPLGTFGTCKDIADGIVYLSSDNARYVTGTEFVIDGGWSA